jgi:hypothetical protein
MVFTNLGRVVAFILLLSGIFHIAGGLMIAAGWLTPEQAALAVFFPRRATTGAVIDRGLYAVLFGIALGILTEISYSLRAQQGHPQGPT